MKINIRQEPRAYRGRAKPRFLITKIFPFYKSHSGIFTHRIRYATHHSLLGRNHLAITFQCGNSSSIGDGITRGNGVIMPSIPSNEKECWRCKASYEHRLSKGLLKKGEG